MSKRNRSSSPVAASLGWFIQGVCLLVLFAFKCAFRSARWGWQQFNDLTDELKAHRQKSELAKSASLVVSRPQQVCTENMAQPVKKETSVDIHADRDFEPTVVMNAPGKGEFIVSDRIKVVPVLAASDVQLGRITLYLYARQGMIRRRFRVDNDYVQTLLGTDRYYMSDVPWNVAAGESELERIGLQSAKEVVDIIDRRQSQYSAAKSRSSRKAQASANGVPSNVANPIRPSQQMPAATDVPATKQVQHLDSNQGIDQLAKTKQTASNHFGARELLEPPVNDVSSNQAASVAARPTLGQRYVGFVAEAGPVDRSGSEGKYKTYCMKLDVNGAHVPFYGVEIERELVERKVRLGDRIEVVFMGRSQISQPGEKQRFKNLFKVTVLKGR